MSKDTNKQIVERTLAIIDGCDEAEKLRKIAFNAQNSNEQEVAIAAKRKLFEILPSEKPGTFEHDVWKSIHALEDALTDERGKTIRLSRTRQKISRDGEFQTVKDLILGTQSQGFDLLVERDMTDLTFEAVSLRHPDIFEDEILAAAEKRLNALDNRS